MIPEIVFIHAFWWSFWQNLHEMRAQQTIAKGMPVGAVLDRVLVAGVRPARHAVAGGLSASDFTVKGVSGSSPIAVLACMADAEAVFLGHVTQRNAVRHVPVPHKVPGRALAPTHLRGTNHGARAAHQDAAPRIWQ